MISVRALTKTFAAAGSDATRPVLRGIDLDVPRGGFLCILGASGCGKSTLLNILAGLDRADTGDVRVDGRSPGARGTRVAYLFQEDRLLSWRTVAQNIDFALRAAKVPTPEWAERRTRYLKTVGLSDYAGHYPHQLSGGMRQRVALARALAIEPDLLLMDEPFSGLDELTARRLRIDILRIWAATGRTIVFVTHNSYEATFLADRIVIMAGGLIRDAIDVTLPRPRSYDDIAVFELNKEVVRRFLLVAGEAEDPRASIEKPGTLVDTLALATSE